MPTRPDLLIKTASRAMKSVMSIRHFVPGAFVIALFLSLGAFLFSLDKTGATRGWLSGPLLLLAVVYGIARSRLHARFPFGRDRSEPCFCR